MKRTIHTMAAAIAITAPVGTAAAQDYSFGIDALVGQVEDDSEQTGADSDTAVVALPSVQFGGDSFTVQVDGLLSDNRSNNVYGGAAHVGAAIGEGSYVGLYGSISETRRHGGLSTTRIGGEVDFDLGTVGVSSVAGYEDTDGGTFLIRTTTTHNVFDVYAGKGRFFAFTDLKFGKPKSFRISVGHRYTGGLHAGAASLAIGLSGNVALMAEGRLGERDYNAALVGVRVRFGGSSEGEDILDNRLLEDLFAPAATRSSLSVALPPPPDEDDDDDDNGCGSCGGYCEA